MFICDSPENRSSGGLGAEESGCPDPPDYRSRAIIIGQRGGQRAEIGQDYDIFNPAPRPPAARGARRHARLLALNPRPAGKIGLVGTGAARDHDMTTTKLDTATTWPWPAAGRGQEVRLDDLPGDFEPATALAATSSAGPAFVPAHVSFTRRELDRILNLYGRKVAAGEWRDYAIDFLKDRAVFSIFRRASEVPIYRIEKNPKLARHQGIYSVISATGLILRRGHGIDKVLQAIDKPMRVVG